MWFLQKTPKQAFEKGLKAEKRALWLLRLKGYRILEHRFRTPWGEIDLIAVKGQTLVFVEVKARQTLKEAAESLTQKQRQRIERAANFYSTRFGKGYAYVRFDVMVGGENQWPRHWKNAWYCNQRF